MSLVQSGRLCDHDPHDARERMASGCAHHAEHEARRDKLNLEGTIKRR